MMRPMAGAEGGKRFFLATYHTRKSCDALERFAALCWKFHHAAVVLIFF